MNSILVLVALVGVASAAFDVYPTKYDTIDLDAILANPRLYRRYLDCLLNKGHCDEEGTILKEVIPDALISGCSKCNDVQRKGVEKVFAYLKKEHIDDFHALTHLYDPTGIYESKYQHYFADLH